MGGAGRPGQGSQPEKGQGDSQRPDWRPGSVEATSPARGGACQVITGRLLALLNHIFHRCGNFLIRAVGAATFGRHGVKTVDGVVNQGIDPLLNTRSPGSGIADDRSAGSTCGMTRQTYGIVDFTARTRAR